MAWLLLLAVTTVHAQLKIAPLPKVTPERALAHEEAIANTPSLWGTGNPIANPDSVENMWKEGLDAMLEKKKAKVAPIVKDREVKDTANKRRIRVVSDMHTGGCWARDKETQQRFMSLLESMSKGNSPDGGPPITHLVMLGDIWDWWLIPLSEPIPKADKLFKATDAYGYNVPKLIELVKKISQHTKIYAVRGNHDDENDHDLNRQAFGNSVQWMEDGFEMNGIWFEHGHVIDMYSNPPVAPDGQKKKGFAYFETRAGAEEEGWQCRHRTKRPTGKHEEQYIDFMRKSVEMVDKPMFMDKNPGTIMWSNWYLKNVVALPQNFVKTHLRWVLKQANPAFKNADYESVPVTGFVKGNQRIEFESKNKDYTLGDAIKDHTYDMELLANKFGSQHALSRLYASGLENHFKWFKASRNHMLVVTGHTHNPYISRMRREKPQHSVTQDIVYANSGAWAQDSYQRDHTSYLDILMDELDEKVPGVLEKGDWYPSKVTLYEYPDEAVRDEQPIPFPTKKPGGFDLWLHPDPNELTVGPVQDVKTYAPMRPDLLKKSDI